VSSSPGVHFGAVDAGDLAALEFTLRLRSVGGADREVAMADDEADELAGRVPLTEAIALLRQADEVTDVGFTDGLRDTLVRFAELFDETWRSDPVFRQRWKPLPTRLRQIFSGRYLDKRLQELADTAGIKIARQMSEHGGHWDFVGTTRYKPPKGGRSLKLRGAFEPDSARRSRMCVGTRSESYGKGEGTYSIAELIISPDGELLMMERDVVGGARHLWAYYVDGFKNRGVAEQDRVTSPDIMDARMLRGASAGAWEHRIGNVRVNRTRLRTGYTASWRAGAPWLDDDEESGVVVVAPAQPRPTS
jgi:hypothetical protein